MMLVPAEQYRDPARFEREVEVVFRRNPLLVALSCDIPNAGDFTTLEIADRPILVVRGDDGKEVFFQRSGLAATDYDSLSEGDVGE